MSRRASRADWVTAGLRILREEGHGRLTIDRLCSVLGKTKGSFYHHFPDLDALHGALLEAWVETLTEQPIALSRAESEPQRRGARLDDVTLALDHRLDREMRVWGMQDRRVHEAVKAVDERRVDYLEELHRAAGRCKPRELAELEYATFVGAQHLDAFDDATRATALLRTLREALARLGERTPKRR